MADSEAKSSRDRLPAGMEIGNIARNSHDFEACNDICRDHVARTFSGENLEGSPVFPAPCRRIISRKFDLDSGGGHGSPRTFSINYRNEILNSVFLFLRRGSSESTRRQLGIGDLCSRRIIGESNETDRIAV